MPIVEGCVSFANTSTSTGYAALVRRGGCSFLDKALAAQQSAASVVVVDSGDSTLYRMGVDPRWKGLEVNITMAVVTNRGWNTLAEHAHRGVPVRFSFDSRVSDAVWQELSLFARGESLPR
jgi:hypothetical protein